MPIYITPPEALAKATISFGRFLSNDSLNSINCPSPNSIILAMLCEIESLISAKVFLSMFILSSPLRSCLLTGQAN